MDNLNIYDEKDKIVCQPFLIKRDVPKRVFADMHLSTQYLPIVAPETIIRLTYDLSQTQTFDMFNGRNT